MSIQILPAQLANQIAAGEVVERPASVVKELIENSLDAGATRIDVEIDKGGAKRILIRDNGKGIGKDELELALSRHATSKIACIDDLESIATLGFRGEALASISSVSRLTLTSRPADQEQAWQARAHGRDMQVDLQPAAHPPGSALEVLDLFYNTPARRKFLRTDKTEFAHIDELLKRLALSRFDVALSLKHNGKTMRQYRIAPDQPRQLRRIASALGKGFTEHCLYLENQHDQLQLTGWLGLADAARAQNDQQYFYVNGRMMRDKLIQHAIRQAYVGHIAEDSHPAYVLYLELPHSQVDVNVHPAKHEVRFHQARLVHDYIVRVLAQTLGAAQQPNLASQWAPEPDSDGAAESDSPVASSHSLSGEHNYSPQHGYQSAGEPRADSISCPASSASSVGSAGGSHDYRSPLRPAVQEQHQAYHQWMDRSAAFAKEHADEPAAVVSAQPDDNAASTEPSTSLRPLYLQEQGYLLAERAGELELWNVNALQTNVWHKQALAQWPQGLQRLPLLLPLQLNLSAGHIALIEQQSEALKRLGIVLRPSTSKKVSLCEVPKLVRRCDFSRALPQFFELMEGQAEGSWQQPELVLDALLSCCASTHHVKEWQQVLHLVQQFDTEEWSAMAGRLSKPVDLTEYIKSF